MVDQIIDKKTVAIPGPIGPIGPRGPINPDTVPTDQAIASWINDDATETYSSIRSTFVTKNDNATALATKANKSDVYTKTEVDSSQSKQDTIIASKADSSSVYTKNYIDSLMSQIKGINREVNPDLSSFTDSPISYNFKRYGARRDWFTSDNGVTLTDEDWEVSPFTSADSRYPTYGGASHWTMRWQKGSLNFTSQDIGKNTYALNMGPLVPVNTFEVKVGGQTDAGCPACLIIAPTTGFNEGSSTYLRIELDPQGANQGGDTETEQLRIHAFVNGTDSGQWEAGAGGTKAVDATWRIMVTGRRIIVWCIYSTDSDRNDSGCIGSWDFSQYFDLRDTKYLNNYSIYYGVRNSGGVSGKHCQIGEFKKRITGGANSVSIRFLTYEDGTYIQRDGCLYYLAENTGLNIDDLYTAIYKFNPELMRVNMIGAIFQKRADGTDSSKILGDDSIKAVYDRNDNMWKIISCGMEYNSSGASSRPKLYGTTTSDLLQGGIIYVTNCKELQFPSAAGYVEDIDFYYDSTAKNWRLVGNNTKTAYTFRTENSALDSTLRVEYTGPDNTASGVRDTGNQFITVGGKHYITAGGVVNNLYVRNDDLTLLGQVSVDVPLSSDTTGPWCTIFPYKGGHGTDMYLATFDRSNFSSPSSGDVYDHGSLLVYKV